MTLVPYLMAGALGLILLSLIRQSWPARARRKAARQGYFATVAPLFDAPRVVTQPSGFPRLAGRWQGLRFDLQAVPDTLTFRKLPSLWVLVTLTEPQSVQGELHIMARPGQNDTFSRFAAMPVSVPLPPPFGEGVALRCDNAALLPPQDLVAGLAPLFDDPRVKELVIAPNALRLVFLAEEADRTRYLIYRDAELGEAPLAEARLLPQLEALADLSRRLKEDAHG